MESLYRRHRFSPEIIGHAVWLYHRFTLSLRDVEDLLAEHGVTVSYEATRSWCRKFGPEYARTLRRRQGRLGDIWHVDEWFITIGGQHHYPWRAVDQDSNVLDILITRHQDRSAAKRFKSAAQVQRFLSVHGPIHNLFRVGRHHLKAVHHRLLGEQAFTEWRTTACAC